MYDFFLQTIIFYDSFSPAMEYTTVSIRIPKWLADQLDSEASLENRNRSQQAAYIFKERYHAHAPLVAPTPKRSSQFHSKASRRRVKTKAEVN